MDTLLVRLKPYDPRRGCVLRRFTFAGIRFQDERGWYRVEKRIGEYLRHHPDRANALDVSTFRFLKQVSVGMDREQVLILLGPPMSATTDQGAVEQLARRYWSQMRDSVTEAWEYPLGWRLFFGGAQLVDIVQYQPPS